MGNTVILSAHRRVRRCVCQFLLASATVLASNLPASAQSVSDALAQCAAISNSTERLACFDRVAAGGERSDAQTVGTTTLGRDRAAVEPAAETDVIDIAGADVAEAVPEVTNKSVAASAAGSGTPTGSLSTNAASVMPASPATERSPVRGDDERKMATDSTPTVAPAETAMSGQPAAATGLGRRNEGNSAVVPPEPDQLSASVEKIAQQPRGEHIVFLDNDQVWVEEFKNSYFPVENGDSVTIKKRRFGGFLLVTESGKTYRVKRLR